MRLEIDTGEFIRRSALVFAVVLALAELAVLLVYFPYGIRRLISEWTITAVITGLVATPVIAFMMMQNMRLKALSERLHVLSSTDEMTGLLNRRCFLEELGKRLAGAAEGRGAGIFLYLDADHFKALNDTYGHAAGDRVIRYLGERIRATVREEDLAARLGGEEFGVFLPDAAPTEALAVAERLRLRAQEAGAAIGVRGLKLSVSIGLAVHRPGMSSDELMHEADIRLYAAKDAGRDRVAADNSLFEAA